MRVRSALFVVQDKADVGYGVFLSSALQAVGVEVRQVALSREVHTHNPLCLAMAKARRLAGMTRRSFFRLCEQAVDQQRTKPADLVIVVKCTAVTEEVLGAFHRTGAALVHINTDHPAQDPGLVCPHYLAALTQYDLVVTFGQPLVPVYYQMGARRVLRLPFACEPAVHRPVSLADHERKVFSAPVTYLGAWGYFQQEWLAPLAAHGLKIFGGLWHHLPPRHPLRKCVNPYRGWGGEMAKACAGATVVVNLTRAEHGCLHTMKTFEIPACGGFMLSNRSAEQEEFFRAGLEAAYFDTREEMLDKVAYYTHHSSERERIRLAGLNAVKPHTYEARARTLLSQL